MTKIDQLIRSKRRTLGIEIDASAQLIIRAPHSLSLDYIEKFIARKRKWITEKQRLMTKRLLRSCPNVEPRSEKSIFERVSFYANLTGLIPDKVRLSNAQTRWGSCYKKNICLSRRLTRLPLEIADYVIVHELVHLKIKNHSKQFWQKVEEIYPRYKEAKKWLQ